MQTFCSARELLNYLAGATPCLIAIDGWHGAGKSWLARTISVCLSRPRLDLDTVLERNKGGFVDHLDIECVTKSIGADRNLVLSGVCMREVFARLGSPPATHIYVKRMHLGTWTHEQEANGNFGDYCLLDQFAHPGPLELEVREYHLRWHPHETADIVLYQERSRRTLL